MGNELGCVPDVNCVNCDGSDGCFDRSRRGLGEFESSVRSCYTTKDPDECPVEHDPARAVQPRCLTPIPAFDLAGRSCREKELNGVFPAGVVDDLLQRFPGNTRQDVTYALEQADGHTLRAGTLLREGVRCPHDEEAQTAAWSAGNRNPFAEVVVQQSGLVQQVSYMYHELMGSPNAQNLAQDQVGYFCIDQAQMAADSPHVAHFGSVSTQHADPTARYLYDAPSSNLDSVSIGSANTLMASFSNPHDGSSQKAYLASFYSDGHHHHTGLPLPRAPAQPKVSKVYDPHIDPVAARARAETGVLPQARQTSHSSNQPPSQTSEKAGASKPDRMDSTHEQTQPSEKVSLRYHDHMGSSSSGFITLREETQESLESLPQYYDPGGSPTFALDTGIPNEHPNASTLARTDGGL